MLTKIIYILIVIHLNLSTLLQPGGDPHVLCFVDFDSPAQATIALEALQGEHTYVSIYVLYCCIHNLTFIFDNVRLCIFIFDFHMVCIPFYFLICLLPNWSSYSVVFRLSVLNYVRCAFFVHFWQHS